MAKKPDYVQSILTSVQRIQRAMEKATESAQQSVISDLRKVDDDLDSIAEFLEEQD